MKPYVEADRPHPPGGLMGGGSDTNASLRNTDLQPTFMPLRRQLSRRKSRATRVEIGNAYPSFKRMTTARGPCARLVARGTQIMVIPLPARPGSGGRGRADSSRPSRSRFSGNYHRSDRVGLTCRQRSRTMTRGPRATLHGLPRHFSPDVLELNVEHHPTPSARPSAPRPRLRAANLPAPTPGRRQPTPRLRSEFAPNSLGRGRAHEANCRLNSSKAVSCQEGHNCHASNPDSIRREIRT